ncbi:MAG TPA: UDP-4-amino-4,6-dideoxy-N-acetyl-beta-L-altrosamine transaminase [Holosporales bacterium]|nr:UDP-4-amino-4,6-dideoxy-N-acetyl-beta-L-altrosamine transaminase [Holosporales bacterium]
MRRSKFLIFGAPRFFQAEIKEILETLRSGWWGTGPKVLQFENQFSEYSHAKYCVAVNSATAAMHLGLNALGVGPGDEVITTPLTFVSTANVIIHTGARPVFADVDKLTGNIDPKEIIKKITKKTKAIIPVHLHGRPCPMDEITQIAKKYKLFVLEDAAHATEAWYHGKKIGSISDLTAFSFYVTKNVATGEGGMLTTNNKAWADLARVRRLHGISADAWKRYSSAGYQPYEAVYPGFKYNMMDLQAALGIHQLPLLDTFTDLRTVRVQKYRQAFQDWDELFLPEAPAYDHHHSWDLFAPTLNSKKTSLSRNEVIDKLKDENIGAGLHWQAPHLFSFYQNTFGFKAGDFPKAEYIADHVLSLPLFPQMTDAEQDRVIRAMRKIFKKD